MSPVVVARPPRRTAPPAWARIVAPIVVGLLLLAVWILWVDVLGTAPRALPSPIAIGQELVLRGEIIGKAMAVTATNALLGLVAGALLAVVLAALAAASRPLDGMLAPLVAALAVIPIVALTPILLASIAAFVPVFVNVLRGLRQTRPVHRDVLRSVAASPWQTFRVLTLPTAVPYLLTGLRIAASLAVIAALVAEYFGGPADGVGTAIASYAKSGRAALAWAFVAGGIAIGSWGWGHLADLIGVEGALIVSGVAMFVSPVLGLWMRMPPVGGHDEAADVLDDPEVQLQLTGRSGPIIVEIEYRVDLNRARTFYRLMQMVQLSRKRNGAYGWSIARDIADPQLWTERYHCPTWYDYLRQRNRATQSERKLHLRAMKFHRGLEPVKIRRMLERPFGSVRWKENSPDYAGAAAVEVLPAATPAGGST
ncbi:MAG: MFS transporter [Rhizobiales bacterium]|nr:MFS transporter [Hyphomicrobiales bacterium]